MKEGYLTNLNWWGRSYDISPDGQRFLMIKENGAEGTAPASIVVVQHWVEELKRLCRRNSPVLTGLATCQGARAQRRG